MTPPGRGKAFDFRPGAAGKGERRERVGNIRAHSAKTGRTVFVAYRNEVAGTRVQGPGFREPAATAEGHAVENERAARGIKRGGPAEYRTGFASAAAAGFT
jgi:hypothetical protein